MVDQKLGVPVRFPKVGNSTLGAALGLVWFMVLFSAFARWAYLVLNAIALYDPVLFFLASLILAAATFWILPLLGMLAGDKWPVRSRPAALPQIPPGTKPIVLLVHGTFAQRGGDQGDAWWQRGGAFSRKIEELAPDGYEALPFHWSGQNLESARRAAAHRLGTWLEELEEGGRGYHIVGHSHAGGVVWLALVECTSRGRRLDHLQSWTTVGTPFFRFRTPAPEIWQALPLVVFAGLGLVGKHALLPMLIKTSQIARVFIAFRKGNLFSPMVTGAFILLTGVFGALLAIDFVWRLTGVLRNRAAQRREAVAYALLKGRHLAVASAMDEAIQGLATARRLDVGDVRLVPSLPYFADSLGGRLLSPLTFPCIGLWNAIMMLPINLWVFEVVRKKIHGDDRWGSTVVTVSSLPEGEAVAGSLLPEEEAALQRAAGDAAGVTLGRVREALGIFASGSSISVLRSREPIPLDALIHNSYFASEPVLDRICAHVLHPPSEPAPGAEAPVPRPRRSSTLWSRTAALPPIVVSLVLVALFAISRALYQAAVEPLTTSARLNALVAETSAAAEVARGQEARVWLAALCASGRCGSIRFGYDADSEDDDQLETALELARWRAACSGFGCEPQQDLLADIGRVVISLNSLYFVQGSEAEGRKRFERRSRELWRIASRLAGVRKAPDGLQEGPKLAPPTPGFPALETQIEALLREVSAEPRIPADLRSRVLYVTPLLRLRVSVAEMQSWDEGVSVAGRLENKVALAEATACRLDLDRPADDSLFLSELRVERIARLSRASSLWWGECGKHLAISRAALAAAAGNYRALPLTGLPRMRLVARLWLAAAQVRADGRALDGKAYGGEATLAQLEDDSRREVEAASVSLASDPDWTSLLPILETIHEQPSAALSPETAAGVERAFQVIVERNPEAWPDLARGCLALATCTALKTALLGALAERPETPVAWDEVLAPFSLLVNRHDIAEACGESRLSLPCRRLHALDKGWVMEGLTRERDSGLVFAEETYLLVELAEARLGGKTTSQVNLQAARGMAAVGKFHQALRYFDSITAEEERLLAASEILLRYELWKRELPRGDVDSLADWGDREWDEARRNWIRENPSH